MYMQFPKNPSFPESFDKSNDLYFHTELSFLIISFFFYFSAYPCQETFHQMEMIRLWSCCIVQTYSKKFINKKKRASGSAFFHIEKSTLHLDWSIICSGREWQTKKTKTLYCEGLTHHWDCRTPCLFLGAFIMPGEKLSECDSVQSNVFAHANSF